jgi:riboflavin kinase/FMN adenylyltransferase
MFVGREYGSWPEHLRGGVVAIGNFDGLHAGHFALLHRLKAAAKTLGVPAILLTFEPHPRRYFQAQAPDLRLMSFAEKARKLKAFGIDAILAQRFNAAFSGLSAETFIQDVLAGALKARKVLTGDDFIFGHQRGGNAVMLRNTKEFDYDTIAPVGNAGEGKFSSSKIREHLRQGEMALAANILGRPYGWPARPVLHGDKRGRTIGFPTANLLPPRLLLPRHGVYAVRAHWGDTSAQGVANLGQRPTVNGQRVQLEVHLFDRDEALYGQKMAVDFVAHLRDEQRFDGLDALKAQIAHDSARAREALTS